MGFSDTDRDRIAAAIGAAEGSTSGEIVCVVDEQPHRYVGTTLTVAACAAFVLPLVAVLFGFDPAALMPWREWSSGDLAQELRAAIEAYAVVQLLIFLGLAALLWWTPLGAALTPRAVKRDRVHAEALLQFRARGLENTRDRTGVLIFACMADHIAEIVADEAIYAKVAPEYWGTAIAALLAGIKAGRPADGFVNAIGLAGEVLAAHFPPRDDDFDELPNRLIEL